MSSPLAGTAAQRPLPQPLLALPRPRGRAQRHQEGARAAGHPQEGARRAAVRRRARAALRAAPRLLVHPGGLGHLDGREHQRRLQVPRRLRRPVPAQVRVPPFEHACRSARVCPRPVCPIVRRAGCRATAATRTSRTCTTPSPTRSYPRAARRELTRNSRPRASAPANAHKAHAACPRPRGAVHNLVRPSPEILRNPRRLKLLERLRVLLRTAENSLIIGFTGTPLCDVPRDYGRLKAIVKGDAAAALSDEGCAAPRASIPRPLWVTAQ
eukprot:892104-Prymnesium_polylepis.1